MERDGLYVSDSNRNNTYYYFFSVKSHCIILVSKGKRESTNYIERDIFFLLVNTNYSIFGRENAAADDDKNAYFQKGIEIHIGIDGAIGC